MNEEKPNLPLKRRILQYFKDNWLTSILLVVILSVLIYQRVPLYLQSREARGTEAPQFELPTLQGDTVSLADLRGKHVLINFWATWCIPCRVEIPLLRGVYEQLEGEQFEILGITTEDPQTVSDFLENNPVNYPILIDRDALVSNAYDLQVYPTMIYIDEEGRIQDSKHGLDVFVRWRLRYRVTGSIL